MKIMYIAPRYHTNQSAIMKALVENGHKVRFLSHYRGKVEDYSYVTPTIVGYSIIFRIFDTIYTKILHRTNPLAVDKKLILGFPSILKLYKYMNDFNPDVVILRERSIYSMFAYMICVYKRYPSILYNQSPLWEKEIKNDAAHKLVRLLTPNIRITPVLGDNSINKMKEVNAFYVPFVMEPQLSPEQKTYFTSSKINILCIGKYEKRKNHFMMIEAIEEISKYYDVRLVITGECTTKFHQQYYNELSKFISEKKLDNKVKLLSNLSREEVNQEYKNADIFVIPSTKEPASISQLEAMSFSLPVICSDTNGTSCYVENGKNGYCFKDSDKVDLKNKIELLISDREQVRKMGEYSYFAVKNKYNFEKYYNRIYSILQDYYVK